MVFFVVTHFQVVDVIINILLVKKPERSLLLSLSTKPFVFDLQLHGFDIWNKQNHYGAVKTYCYNKVWSEQLPYDMEELVLNIIFLVNSTFNGKLYSGQKVPL